MFSYVLFCNDRTHRFWAPNDRAAKGKARRLIGGKPHSTYYIGDEWQGMRPVQGYNLSARYNCETAALYCDGSVDAT